jgi:2-polyprenyl-3-methyl-5-hydroxy-6-metoxy-1,4-benzoquinol methylase
MSLMNPSAMKCRHCGAHVTLPLADLGSAPPSNAYLTEATLREPERWYPLRVLVCEHCWLVQTEDFARADHLFDAEYAYFSSYSSSWLVHAQQYVHDMVQRFGLDEHSHVVEVAANDGYLLQYFVQRGVPCLGIEPTASTAAAARDKGIPVIELFFGVQLARQLVAQSLSADLMTANNVLAHVPNINDFVAGFAVLLKPNGVATFEFPHLLQLVQQCQFDTLYHEHFSYLSFTAVQRIFDANGLTIFDVEELTTHGGSLRVLARRTDSFGGSNCEPVQGRVAQMLSREAAAGVTHAQYYRDFQSRVLRIKRELLLFLMDAQIKGKKVAAYGAAAKGNTLFNFAGVRRDLVHYVVDKNPAKQGKFMPGSRIPIVDEAYLLADRPDHVLILPWNLKDEVVNQLAYIRGWDGRFFTAVPGLEIV